MLPLEGTLLEMLLEIEALHAGTKIDGARRAARGGAEPREAINEDVSEPAETGPRNALPEPSDDAST